MFDGIGDERVVLPVLQEYNGTTLFEECQHSDVREIGEDVDQNGEALRLVRCQHCSLLIREYLARD